MVKLLSSKFDFTLFKRVKFTDRLKEETDDVPKDQVEARLDAEFALMSAEVCTLMGFLRTALNLNEDNL